MATIELFNPTFYKNGVSGVSGVVGYESKANRVVRYNMVPPSTGANHIGLTFRHIDDGNGTIPQTLNFYIGTDPDSHANAGVGSACTGTLTRSGSTGNYTYTGSADFILLPATTYYVWVFPTSTTFGWVYWGYDAGDAIAETSGGAFAALTAGNGTLGVAQTLTVTRYNAEFTHTITCAIGSATETICEKDTGTSYLWTPPLALAAQIPNAAKGAATFTIYTYNGDTLIGSQPVPVEMNVPDSIVPTVSATWSDTSGAKDKMGTFVKLVSTLAVDVVGVGAYGSTITGASMTLNGRTYTGGVIMDDGDLALVVTVNDSRGRSGSAAYTVTVADYAVPSVMLNASRCDEDGTANDMGEFARVTITGTVVQVNEANTAKLQLTYGAATETYAFEPGAIEHVQIIPAPSVSTLAIAATLTDQLKSTAQSMVLSIGYATMDFLAGGKGIAMGSTARQEGFHCAMPAYFTGGLGGDIADYVVEEGASGIWYYRKWNSGRIELYGYSSYSFAEKTASPAGAMYIYGNTLGVPSGLLSGVPVYAFGTTNIPGFVYITLWNSTAASINTYITTCVQYGTNNSCAVNYYVIGRWK